MGTNIILNNENTTIIINRLKKESDKYKTLTKEEEKRLIEKYKNNREYLNKLLFMHNIKAVFNIAKKYILNTNDFDNMVQNGMLGLAEACNRFDINKDIKFITYATWWIRKYILSYFYSKQIKMDKRSISIDTKVNDNDESNRHTLESYINEYIDKSYDNTPTINQELSSNEQVDICNKLMTAMKNDTSLSSLDKEVFVKLMYEGEKPKKIAETYNITTQNITSIKNRILNKFRNILRTEYDVHSYYDIGMI